MVRIAVPFAGRLVGATLATATLGALLLTGCRPAPDSPAAARAVLTDRVILAWQTPPGGSVAALLDASAGPAARLLELPGGTNFAAVDAALRRLNAVRPVAVPEPAQAGAMRLLVDRRLATDATRPALLAELNWSLADGRTAWPREVAREELLTGDRSPATRLALEHRAELFRQLAASFSTLAQVPPGAVLTNAAAVAAAHGELAGQCAALAQDLETGVGRGLRRPGDAWAAPGEPAAPVRLGAFAGEWRVRAAAFGSHLPRRAEVPGADAAPVNVPPGWLARWGLVLGPLSDLEDAINATARAWEARRRALGPVDRSPAAQPLVNALVAACADDQADLEKLARSCAALPAATLPPEVFAQYGEVAQRAHRASRALAAVRASLGGGSVPPAGTGDVRE